MIVTFSNSGRRGLAGLGAARLLGLQLLVLPEVVGPGVVHVRRVQPARVQHERVERARMAVGKVWGRRRRFGLVMVFGGFGIWRREELFGGRQEALRISKQAFLFEEESSRKPRCVKCLRGRTHV